MKVSRHLKGDFDLVCKHYSCAPDEVELMKVSARADMEAAEECFAALAEEIHPERGVNRRIRMEAKPEEREAA